MMNRPILGITMGDPFGNGPEITVRALNDKTIYDRCRPLVVGDLTSMEYALRVAGKESGINLELNPVQKVQVYLRYHRRIGPGAGACGPDSGYR